MRTIKLISLLIIMVLTKTAYAEPLVSDALKDNIIANIMAAIIIAIVVAILYTVFGRSLFTIVLSNPVLLVAILMVILIIFFGLR
jgi:hypothetical protein